jgi:hypothetical protein
VILRGFNNKNANSLHHNVNSLIPKANSLHLAKTNNPSKQTRDKPSSQESQTDQSTRHQLLHGTTPCLSSLCHISLSPQHALLDSPRPTYFNSGPGSVWSSCLRHLPERLRWSCDGLLHCWWSNMGCDFGLDCSDNDFGMQCSVRSLLCSLRCCRPCSHSLNNILWRAWGR